MKITNNENLPQSIYEAVQNDPYDAGESDITVTTLIGPARKRALLLKHKDEIVEDCSERIWSLFGQAIHTILERSETDSIAEERFYMTCKNGWKLGGQVDRFEPFIGLLQDFKTTSVWSVKGDAKNEYVQQLNILAHLLRKNGFTVNKLEIIAILRDWSKREAQRDKEYPRHNVVKLDIPLWSPEETEAFIDSRVAEHEKALKEEVKCSDAERWCKAHSWAVIKKGQKRATKVFYNEKEAGSFAADDPNMAVEFRPGEVIRCGSYCNVNKFCSQYQEEVK